MKQYFNFIISLFFVFSSSLVKAGGPTCEGIFNEPAKKPAEKIAQKKPEPVIDQKAVQEYLNRFPVISQYELQYYSLQKLKTATDLIEDLIDKKMLNSPDLAYTTLLYLMKFDVFNSYRTRNKVIQKIIDDPQLYQLVTKGQRLDFSNRDLNEHIKLTENRKGTYYYFGDGNPASFKLFMDLLRPSDVKNIDEIATALSSKMLNILRRTNTSYYSSLPKYNRFKVLKTILKKHLGVSQKDYQEILVFGDDNAEKRVVVISNQTIQGEDAHLFNVSMKTLDVFNSNTSFENKHYSWKINGQVFSAEVTYKNHGDVQLEIPKANAPSYAEMLSDKKLTGVVIAAVNVSEYSQDLEQGYLDYFSSQKLKIVDSKNASSEEVRNLILDLARKGEIDYFLREGHSESGPETMVSLSENNRFYKLSLNRAGFVEEVYLIIPTTKVEKQGVNLDYSSFGQALRARAVQNQVICFNSSCYGHDDTDSSFEFVAAKGFTPIGSTKMLDTFTGEPHSAVYEFLDGIRNQKSYPDMTKNINAYEDLITPDHEDYKAGRSGLTVPVIDLIIKRNFPHN